MDWVPSSVAVDGAGNVFVAGANFCAKIQPSSSLRVVIAPPESITAGAHWRRVGSVNWLASGETDTHFPAGTSTIEFMDLDGWVTPCSVSVNLLDGQTVSLTNTYSWKLSDLAWSRNLGCMSNWFAPACACDSQGNLLIAGTTTSAGWVSGGYNTNLQGQDGFVIKLSPAGVPLWSTYVGGSGDEAAYGIAVDPQDNIWVTGYTHSDSGWISGGYDTSYNGFYDGFVVKLSPSGAHLWSTYLGGSQRDYANAVAVDSLGNGYVAGFTESTNWVSGGYDTTFNGAWDGFVVKISPAGAHLWSTYLGGTSFDEANRIALDGAGNPLVTGQTLSSNWVAGGFDLIENGTYDGFVVKLNSAGAHLWSTYLGSAGYASGDGITVDASNNVLVTGYGLPVMKLSSAGTATWSCNAVGSAKILGTGQGGQRAGGGRQRHQRFEWRL